MKKALLIIDIQNGLTLKKKLYQADDFILTVNRAIDSFRSGGDLVVFVQHNNRLLEHGTEDWQLDGRLNCRPDDSVFEKQNGNAFLNTGISALLKEQDVTDVVVCGLVTHGCIWHTCLGAQAEGFDTYILSGGHTSWHAKAQDKIDETEAKLAEAGINAYTMPN